MTTKSFFRALLPRKNSISHNLGVLDAFISLYPRSEGALFKSRVKGCPSFLV